MPWTTISVGRVDSMPTREPGVTGHVVTACDLVGGCGFQVHTVSDLAASLCDQARKQGKQVNVLWKDGRFGRQLVHVELTDEQAVEHGAVA